MGKPWLPVAVNTTTNCLGMVREIRKWGLDTNKGFYQGTLRVKNRREPKRTAGDLPTQTRGVGHTKEPQGAVDALLIPVVDRAQHHDSQFQNLGLEIDPETNMSHPFPKRDMIAGAFALTKPERRKLTRSFARAIPAIPAPGDGAYREPLIRETENHSPPTQSLAKLCVFAICGRR